jgi:hypothetical protein
MVPYARLQNLIDCKFALMPNTTRAKSFHVLIKRHFLQKKVDFLETCKMDQNRAMTQIAADALYLDGAY